MKKINLLLFFICFSIFVSAQKKMSVPDASQEAAVMQHVGLTKIKISYHSPLTNGRTIWGDVVPYNEVWRAGANENTTITFSTEVMVEGKKLAAGTYGLHMIPTQKEWTVIFNRNSTAWGSFFYDEKEDAVRVTVTPLTSEMQEWLSYSFADIKPQSATAMMKWEKKSVPFKITVDVPEVVFQNMKNELTGLSGFGWQGHQEAAAYAINNNIHLDEAEAMIDRSIKMQKTFLNLNTKSKLLALQGKTTEADAMKKEALTMADENQLNAYGYELIAAKKLPEATEIFKMNVKKHPDSWNVYDSLGEAQAMTGEKKSAIANYKTAMAKAPEDQKKRIGAVLKKLEGKDMATSE